MPARRTARPAAPSASGRSTSGLPAEVHSWLSEELRRLHELAAAPERRRQAWLENLATRLAAMARDLPGKGTPAPVVEQLRELARQLSAFGDVERAPRGADLDRLWRRCEEVLGSLVGAAAAPVVPPAPGEAVRRQDFWKT